MLYVHSRCTFLKYIIQKNASDEGGSQCNISSLHTSIVLFAESYKKGYQKDLCQENLF